MLSAIATVINAKDPEEIDKIISDIEDPACTFYRMSIPGAILRRKIVKELIT